MTVGITTEENQFKDDKVNDKFLKKDAAKEDEPSENGNSKRDKIPPEDNKLQQSNFQEDSKLEDDEFLELPLANNESLEEPTQLTSFKKDDNTPVRKRNEMTNC